MSFLISSKNLHDLTNAEEARNNLGLGTICTQDSNLVNITGGSIYADQIILNQSTSQGNYAIALDDVGTIGFRSLDIPDWVNQSTPSDILISTFVNDIKYVLSNDLSDVCFTGSFNDLADIPESWGEFVEVFGVDNRFLLSENNLSDVDSEEAGLNLGLGSLAYMDNVNFSVSNLTVNYNFIFDRHLNPGEEYSTLYLGLNEHSYAEWKELPYASRTTPGIIILSDTYMNYNEDTDEFTAASTKAMHDVYTDIQSRLDDLNTTENDEIIRLIGDFGLLKINDNMGGLSDLQKDTLKGHLSLGSIAQQNVDDVEIETLTVNTNFQFKEGQVQESQSGDKFMKSDENGNISLTIIPNADDIIPGLVYLQSSLEIANKHTTASVNAINNEFNNVYTQLETLLHSIPTHINQLQSGDDVLVNSFDNIKVAEAKTNLGLHIVATTGNYHDLVDKKTKLSDFDDDVSGFLKVSNNLSDLSTDEAYNSRISLGLGTMSTQNSNNVNIVNGIANFQDVTVTGNFTFLHHVDMSDNNPLYLQCTNIAGQAAWTKLPPATETTYGVVKFTSSLVDVEKGSVISGFGFAKVYNELISRIQQLRNSIDDKDDRRIVEEQIESSQQMLVTAVREATF